MIRFLWAVAGLLFCGVILMAMIGGKALAWLRGKLIRVPGWTQDDLSSAWRKKMRAHVTGEPARLSVAEEIAWHETHGRRRGAYIWGE
jgi:hypothetical protein